MIDVSNPGRPTNNALVESVNGTFRVECLNAHWVHRPLDAMQRIESWPAMFDPTPEQVALNFTDAETYRNQGIVSREDVDGARALSRFFIDQREIVLSRHLRSGNTRLRHCHVADGFRQLLRSL
jgi:hypothetical protein